MITINQWHVLKSAPHRVMFLGGALQTLAVMLWFMVELLTRYSVFMQPITWTIAPSYAHAYLMIFGMFPLFMFGVQMTTFPRWMKGVEIPQKLYVPAFVLLMSGAIGFYAGLIVSQTLLISAVCCTLSGWGFILYALMRVLLDTPPQDKRHPKIIFGALYLGWCCQFSYLVFLVSDNFSWLRFSVEGGVWLFLLPVFTTVAHRMIPFFTSSALPQTKITTSFSALWIILIASATHCLLDIFGSYIWLWLCDFPLALAAIYLSHSWKFTRSQKIPLLAVLHISFAWLSIAMLLFTLQSWVLFISNGGIFIGGLAPLHALTLGFFATFLIGMATRVTLGHSGLPMVVDKPIKIMFSGIQLAAGLRVLADFLPMENRQWLYFAAGAVWLGCFTPWVVRYLPVYLKRPVPEH